MIKVVSVIHDDKAYAVWIDIDPTHKARVMSVRISGGESIWERHTREMPSITVQAVIDKALVQDY